MKKKRPKNSLMTWRKNKQSKMKKTRKSYIFMLGRITIVKRIY